MRGLTVEAFGRQAEICAEFGSSLYAELFARCAGEIPRGGPLADLLADWDGDPIRGALPLRLMGGVHGLVLSGEAPALAGHFPSAGGSPTWPAAWNEFLELVTARAADLRPALAEVPQTNEVHRSCALIGGFLALAAETGSPLELLEIGASAGLNLLWDRFRYVLGVHQWGDPDAPVSLGAQWEGPPPPLSARVAVVGRRGCDLQPVDLSDPERVRTLEACVWADQIDRLRSLRHAIAFARLSQPRVDRQRAALWLEQRLAERSESAATVVYHSVVWPYLDVAERTAISELLEETGRTCTPRAPLAWLRLENDPSIPSERARKELRLSVWPPGEDRLLGLAHPHGLWVHWGTGGSRPR